MSFKIVTDSCCNLPYEIMQQLDLQAIDMLYIDENGTSYTGNTENQAKEYHKFYQDMRNGATYSTSLPNLEKSTNLFKEILDEGHDIMYLGFSGALSSTFDTTSMLLSQLAENYPNQKAYALDTLGASLGEGMIVYYAARMAQDGATIEQTKQWVEDNKLHFAHFFTVDTLTYLFKGGRISKSAAWAGNLLNVKPVLHVNNAGELIPLHKVRGRKKSISTMFDKMKETYVGAKECPCIMIGHGDCMEDAKALEHMIRNEWDVKDVIINYIDPVIGAHCGPGVLALFFKAKHR